MTDPSRGVVNGRRGSGREDKKQDGQRFSNGSLERERKRVGMAASALATSLCSSCLHFQHTLPVPNAPLVPLLLPKACSIGPSSLSLSISSSLTEGTQTDEKIARAACQ